MAKLRYAAAAAAAVEEACRLLRLHTSPRRPSVRWLAHCILLFSAGRPSPRGVSDLTDMNLGRLEQFDEISRQRRKGLMGFRSL